MNLKRRQWKSKSWGTLPSSQHFGGRTACWSCRMGTRKSDKHQLFTRTCTNQPTSWLVRSWNTLVHGRAMSKHELTKFTMARTWGKSPPSPLQYTLCLAMGPAPKCHFVSRFPSGSLKIFTIAIPTTLETHNFMCRPSIEMKFIAKL